MEEKIILDTLNQDSVSIIKQQYTKIDGKAYLIGEPWRKAYVNSTDGREEVNAEVTEPYLSAIMAIWGDTATVVVSQ